MRAASVSSLSILATSLLSLAPACATDDERAPCGPDEVRIAERCVPISPADTRDAVDADTADTAPLDTSDPVDTTDTRDTTDTLSDTASDAPDTSPVALPLFIDEFFVMSGYMGSGEVEVAPCGPKTPAGSGAGACFAITWTPATGTTADWVGFYFQYPENNWGSAPGFDMPAGATRVTFSTWGELGGESANFAVGIQAADGFQRESGYSLLTTTPSTRQIALPATYDDVAGGFAWFLDNPSAKSSVTFYLDDIRWEGAPSGGSGCTDPDATNYDAAATSDDGSCTFLVTFEVDMGCPDPDTAFATVFLTGPFCQWCGEGFQLLDPDGDDVYTGAWAFPNGPLEYKFMTNGFASQEDLIDDANANGTCAPITDRATYANRRVTIDGAPTTVTATYGSCGACP